MEDMFQKVRPALHPLRFPLSSALPCRLAQAQADVLHCACATGYSCLCLPTLSIPAAGIHSSSLRYCKPCCSLRSSRAQIAQECFQLAKYTKKPTMTSREVQTAVRLILPGELAKHAVSEGTKAVTKYTSA